jgi:hypothetical protein
METPGQGTIGVLLAFFCRFTLVHDLASEACESPVVGVSGLVRWHRSVCGLG